MEALQRAPKKYISNGYITPAKSGYSQENFESHLDSVSQERAGLSLLSNRPVSATTFDIKSASCNISHN